MDRYPARLAIFGASNVQQPLLEIDVRADKPRRFGNPEARCRHQSKDRCAACAAQAARWVQMIAGRQQVKYLVIRKYVWRQSSMGTSKKSARRNLGCGVELTAVG